MLIDMISILIAFIYKTLVLFSSCSSKIIFIPNLQTICTGRDRNNVHILNYHQWRASEFCQVLMVAPSCQHLTIFLVLHITFRQNTYLYDTYRLSFTHNMISSFTTGIWYF